MNAATQIWDEAHQMLETLEILDLPKLESQDFRQGLEFILEKAKSLGAEVESLTSS